MIDVVKTGSLIGRFVEVDHPQLTGQRLELRLAAGHAHEVGIEPADVVFQQFALIAVRIHGDEDHLRFFLAPHQFKLFHAGGQHGQRIGADIRAIGKAEEQQVPLTLQVGTGESLAGGRFQLEVGDDPGGWEELGGAPVGAALHDAAGKDQAGDQGKDGGDGEQKYTPVLMAMVWLFDHGVIISRSASSPDHAWYGWPRPTWLASRCGAISLITLETFIRHAAEQMDAAGLHFGHGTDNALDEACWLASAALGLNPGFGPEAYALLLDNEQQARAERLLRERINARKPLAYLLGEAWLAGLSFEVNESVLVPRSPLAELIIDGFEPWLPDQQLGRAVDIGTGSGCLAVALAVHRPGVDVDALDISAKALELARRNAERHGVSDRVRCLESDLLSAVAGQRYDLILANPPYVPEASMQNLPPEYLHEPRLGLVAGADGLDLVRRLLIDAPAHMSEHGILICEVGEAAEALESLIGEHCELVWIEFAHGGDGVFLLDKPACQAAARHLAAESGP